MRILIYFFTAVTARPHVATPHAVPMDSNRTIAPDLSEQDFVSMLQWSSQVHSLAPHSIVMNKALFPILPNGGVHYVFTVHGYKDYGGMQGRGWVDRQGFDSPTMKMFNHNWKWSLIPSQAEVTNVACDFTGWLIEKLNHLCTHSSIRQHDQISLVGYSMGGLVVQMSQMDVAQVVTDVNAQHNVNMQLNVLMTVDSPKIKWSQSYTGLGSSVSGVLDGDYSSSVGWIYHPLCVSPDCCLNQPAANTLPVYTSMTKQWVPQYYQGGWDGESKSGESDIFRFLRELDPDDRRVPSFRRVAVAPVDSLEQIQDPFKLPSILDDNNDGMFWLSKMLVIPPDLSKVPSGPKLIVAEPISSAPQCGEPGNLENQRSTKPEACRIWRLELTETGKAQWLNFEEINRDKLSYVESWENYLVQFPQSAVTGLEPKECKNGYSQRCIAALGEGGLRDQREQARENAVIHPEQHAHWSGEALRILKQIEWSGLGIARFLHTTAGVKELEPLLFGESPPQCIPGARSFHCDAACKAKLRSGPDKSGIFSQFLSANPCSQYIKLDPIEQQGSLSVTYRFFPEKKSVDVKSVWIEGFGDKPPLESSPAGALTLVEQAGGQFFDEIVSINGRQPKHFPNMHQIDQWLAKRPLDLVVKRRGTTAGAHMM